MSKNIVETIIGAAVLLVAGGFLVFFLRTADIRPTSGYTLTASFSQVDGLQPGAPVRISGIKVGQVLAMHIDPDTYNAIVTMNIDDGVTLPRDTAAVVTSAGLLDGKFMTLQPGGDDDMLEPGARIDYTQASPSLEQLLGQVIFSLTGGKDDKNAPQTADSAATEETP